MPQQRVSNVDGTPATPYTFNGSGQVLDQNGNATYVPDPTGNPTGRANNGSVYDPQGGVHDNPLYDYSSAPEVAPNEIERLRVDAGMGKDGPALQGYQKNIAGQLLDADKTGPSYEREDLMAARDFDPIHGSIRSVDPNAYAESNDQQDASNNLNSLSNFYAAGRTSPQATGATVDQSLGQLASSTSTNQRQVNVGPMAQSQGATLGSAAQAANTNIDTSDEQQLRDIQVKQANRLDATASGTGPSLADAILQKGQDQALANQISGAQASRGFSNVGGLQKNLANTAALGEANASGAAAQSKVAEQQNAESQLNSSVSGARSLDIGVAGQQAGLTQGNNQFNASSTNQQTANQGQLTQQNEQFNAGQTNSGTSQQASINATAAANDANATNSLNQTFVNRDSQMKLANLDVASRTQLANLDSQLKMMGMDDNMRLNLMQQQLNQANVLKAQGISYDSAAVSESIAKDNARRSQANTDAAATHQYVSQGIGALTNLAANS